MGLNLSLIKKLSYYFFKRYRGGGLDKGEYIDIEIVERFIV